MQLVESICPQCGMIHKAERQVDFFGCCQTVVQSVVTDQKKTVRIESSATPKNPPQPKPDTTNQPGSVLYRIIRDTFSVKPKSGCGCYKLRDEMDALGVEGCQAEFGLLVDRLKENAKAYRWLESFGAALNAVRNGALSWLDPFRPWESILKHAIETSIELKAVTDAGKEIDKTSEGNR